MYFSTFVSVYPIFVFDRDFGLLKVSMFVSVLRVSFNFLIVILLRSIALPF